MDGEDNRTSFPESADAKTGAPKHTAASHSSNPANEDAAVTKTSSPQNKAVSSIPGKSSPLAKSHGGGSHAHNGPFYYPPAGYEQPQREPGPYTKAQFELVLSNGGSPATQHHVGARKFSPYHSKSDPPGFFNPATGHWQRPLQAPREPMGAYPHHGAHRPYFDSPPPAKSTQGASRFHPSPPHIKNPQTPILPGPPGVGDNVGPYRFSDPTLRRQEAAARRSRLSRNGKTITTIPVELVSNEVRNGATSPTQIEISQREEVGAMGCTCKKTKCLKLYCQCFAVKIYCGPVCRCQTCFNNEQHDEERKNAVRLILSRNPKAFDTKFKKTSPLAVVEAGGDPTDSSKLLLHKVGCKCRKSACMKKYCECYAGFVKCGPSCRCIGCKNTANEDSKGGDGADDVTMVDSDAPLRKDSGKRRKKREPVMMDAAQNLAFMKHGSPAAPKSVRRINSGGEMISTPSLDSENSTSPPRGSSTNHQSNRLSFDAEADTFAQQPAEPSTSEKTAADALLMAAMMMSGMSDPAATSQSPNSSDKCHKRTESEEAEPASLHSRQSALGRGEASSNDSSPSGRSPGSTASKREHPDDTPTDFHSSKTKRTKMESHGKAPRNLLRQIEKMEGSNMATPARKGKPSEGAELTPVSALSQKYTAHNISSSATKAQISSKTE